MTSWRDSASQQAQDDLDELLNASLPFAQQLLDRHGEFFPFAATMTASGETRLVAGDPDQGEQPNSTDVLQTLAAGLRSELDQLRATALISDLRLVDSDAVRVELEHSEGHALAVLLRYKKRRLRRGADYGDLAAAPADRQIWT
ncbi:MAG: hypothetical protein GY701_32860 [Sulfitobacter sp.]|nr:hypothetical protein [Sulfitobacter sp.]